MNQIELSNRSLSSIHEGVILFQSHFRRRMALKQTESLRQKLLEDSATKIQAAWRGFAASIRYTWSIYDVVLVQSLVRRWLARRYIHEALEEKYRKEMAAATKIQAQWRGFSDFRDYMILLGGMSLPSLCYEFIAIENPV